MPNVTFHGGPCARETHSYTDAALADGKVTCKGALYDTFDNHAGGYFAVLDSVVQADTPVGAPVPHVKAAAHAWKDLVRGATRTAPRYLQESARYRRAMLRIGRR